MEDISLPQHFLCKIKELYEQNDLCDVTFTVTPGGDEVQSDTGSIQMHSVILAAHSPVFRTLFNKKRAGKNRWCLLVRAEKMEHWRTLARFMYTGNIDLNTVNVDAIYQLAGVYGMDRVSSLCETFRRAHRDITNINCVNSAEQEYVNLNEVYQPESGTSLGEMLIIKREDVGQVDDAASREKICNFDVEETLYTEGSGRLPGSSTVQGKHGQGHSASSEGHSFTVVSTPDGLSHPFGHVNVVEVTAAEGVSGTESTGQAMAKQTVPVNDKTLQSASNNSELGDISLMMEVEEQDTFDGVDSDGDYDDQDSNMHTPTKCLQNTDTTSVQSVSTEIPTSSPNTLPACSPVTPASLVSVSSSQTLTTHVSVKTRDLSNVSSPQKKRKRGRPRKMKCRHCSFTGKEEDMLQHKQKEHSSGGGDVSMLSQLGESSKTIDHVTIKNSVHAHLPQRGVVYKSGTQNGHVHLVDSGQAGPSHSKESQLTEKIIENGAKGVVKKTLDAWRQREYRKRLKADEERYQRFKEKECIRSAKRRALPRSSAQIEKDREASRIRARRYREKLKQRTGKTVLKKIHIHMLSKKEKARQREYWRVKKKESRERHAKRLNCVDVIKEEAPSSTCESLPP